MNMMYHGMCKCPHHKVGMVFSLLAAVAVVLFFWTAYKGTLLGFGPQFYFDSAIMLTVLEFSMKACGCCWKGMRGGMGKTAGGMACKCGDPGCDCSKCETCK